MGPGLNLPNISYVETAAKCVVLARDVKVAFASSSGSSWTAPRRLQDCRCARGRLGCQRDRRFPRTRIAPPSIEATRRYRHAMHSAQHIPIQTVIPFLLTLAGIALLPIAVPRFWHRNRNKALFTVLFAAPIVPWLLSTHSDLLGRALSEYGSFIALLGSLFLVCGGIHLGGDLRATPRNNTLILAAGGILASAIGTTGASMLLIRFLLRTNSQRRHVSHAPFFFILLVSNAGGLLTPLGDPPLFLGYLNGVPFRFPLTLWKTWLLAVGFLLTVFWLWDRRAYMREAPADLALDTVQASP